MGKHFTEYDADISYKEENPMEEDSWQIGYNEGFEAGKKEATMDCPGWFEDLGDCDRVDPKDGYGYCPDCDRIDPEDYGYSPNVDEVYAEGWNDCIDELAKELGLGEYLDKFRKED